MIKYKIDVLDELKNKGYSTYRIRKEKIFGNSLVSKLNNGDTNITLKQIDLLCELLDCRIDDIIEYVPDEVEETNQIINDDTRKRYDSFSEVEKEILS